MIRSQTAVRIFAATATNGRAEALVSSDDAQQNAHQVRRQRRRFARRLLPDPGVGTGSVLAYTTTGEGLAFGDARPIEQIPFWPVENVAIAPISGGVTIRGLK